MTHTEKAGLAAGPSHNNADHEGTPILSDVHAAFLENDHAIPRSVAETVGICSDPQGGRMAIPWRDEQTEVWEFRVDDDRRKEGQPKYLWPKQKPILNHLRPVGDRTRVLLVEGTLQPIAALAYAPEDYAVLGMHGCDGVYKETELGWAAGKDISVMFDADRLTKPNVRAASDRVTALLRKAGANSVTVIDIPGKGKEGLDDLLAERLPERRAGFLAGLLAAATPASLSRLDSAFFDCNDLDNITSAEPLISGLLDVATLVTLSGKFGTYKTFLALSWAAHLATGRAWGDTHAVPVAVPVIYVAAEGVTAFNKRLKAWSSAYGPIPRGMLHVEARPVRLTDEADVAWMRDRITATNTKLAIFDTLHRCAPGVDENSAKEMGVIIERAASLRDDTGCTVLLVHHTGHEGRRARGSSAIDDDADTAFVVRLTGDEEDRGATNPRILEHRKSKDGELLASTTLRLVEVPEVGSVYVEVDTFSTPGGPREAKVATLIAQADRMGLADNLSAAKILDSLRAVTKITKWESEQVARKRKARGENGAGDALPENSPDSPHPHRGVRGESEVQGPGGSPKAPGSFPGNSELGKLQTPQNPPEAPGNVVNGHSPTTESDPGNTESKETNMQLHVTALLADPRDAGLDLDLLPWHTPKSLAIPTCRNGADGCTNTTMSVSGTCRPCKEASPRGEHAYYHGPESAQRAYEDDLDPERTAYWLDLEIRYHLAEFGHQATPASSACPKCDGPRVLGGQHYVYCQSCRLAEPLVTQAA